MPVGKIAKTIFVLPVPHTSVQGRNKYSFMSTSGDLIPAGRQFARGVEIPVPFTSKNGFLQTGMDEVITNPYFGIDLEKVPKDLKVGEIWRTRYDSQIKSLEEISYQFLFEILDNREKGFYTNEKVRVSMSEGMADIETMRGRKPTFLEKFAIRFNESVTTLSGKTSRGRLGIFLCENTPSIIARNKDSINLDIHRFYIASENEAIIAKNTQRKRVEDAVGKLAYIKNTKTSFVVYQFAVILDLVKGQQNPDIVESELSDFIWEQKKKNGATQMQRIDKFERLVDLFKKDKDRFYIRYLLKQAVKTAVFRIHTGTGDHLWTAKKGFENLYNLGRSKQVIENMFLQEYLKFDPSLQEDNLFYDLESELKAKQVQCK